jgi:hypothetical protein
MQIRQLVQLDSATNMSKFEVNPTTGCNYTLPVKFYSTLPPNLRCARHTRSFYP